MLLMIEVVNQWISNLLQIKNSLLAHMIPRINPKYKEYSDYFTSIKDLKCNFLGQDLDLVYL